LCRGRDGPRLSRVPRLRVGEVCAYAGPTRRGTLRRRCTAAAKSGRSTPVRRVSAEPPRSSRTTARAARAAALSVRFQRPISGRINASTPETSWRSRSSSTGRRSYRMSVASSDTAGYYRRMQAAVEELLILKGIVTPEDVQRQVDAMDARNYKRRREDGRRAPGAIPRTRRACWRTARPPRGTRPRVVRSS